MIENLSGILAARNEQFGKINPAVQEKVQEVKNRIASDEGLLLLLDYMEKSNKQLKDICQSILDNQKIILELLQKQE